MLHIRVQAEVTTLDNRNATYAMHMESKELLENILKGEGSIYLGRTRVTFSNKNLRRLLASKLLGL